MVNFFIHRPTSAASIAILMVLAGAAAYQFVPLAQLSEVTPPRVTVTATYPGATSDAVANIVTTPLEEQINGVQLGKYVYVAHNGRAAQRMASIGATYGDRIAIAQGFIAAGTVIARNLQRIAWGAPVQSNGGPRQASSRPSASAASG